VSAYPADLFSGSSPLGLGYQLGAAAAAAAAAAASPWRPLYLPPATASPSSATPYRHHSGLLQAPITPHHHHTQPALWSPAAAGLTDGTQPASVQHHHHHHLHTLFKQSCNSTLHYIQH